MKKMYKVMVVDDEPTGLKHVCTILEKKCAEYKLMGTAQNGQEALEMIRIKQPDILITDVKMPVMDGISLVSKVKQEYPEILSVIVSGYSEFDYAKGALQSGVCDYLLKPLSPGDMQKLMDRLKLRLNTLYYEKRNYILRKLCSKAGGAHEELSRYFPEGNYYSAIFRRGGLTRRFSGKTGVEIFSMEEEKVYMYGRDEREALYLFPEELLMEDSVISFEKAAERLFDRQRDEQDYTTAVIYEEKFSLDQFPEVAEKLYRRLDEAIVIGKDKFLERSSFKEVHARDTKEKEKVECVEYLIRYQDESKLLSELDKLFCIWEQGEYNQLFVESRVRYIFQLIRNVYTQDDLQDDIEFMIDDAFYYATNMEELKESILTLVKRCVPTLLKEKIDNKEQLFQSILSYLNGHIEEQMSLGSICREFGVSQTSLSRMFRVYKETSFSNYLTKIRIEKAQQIMDHDPTVYIKDIAERCGYVDQFYFSRIFRSVTGKCPKEYIEAGKVL